MQLTASKSALLTSTHAQNHAHTFPNCSNGIYTVLFHQFACLSEYMSPKKRFLGWQYNFENLPFLLKKKKSVKGPTGFSSVVSRWAASASPQRWTRLTECAAASKHRHHGVQQTAVFDICQALSRLPAWFDPVSTGLLYILLMASYLCQAEFWGGYSDKKQVCENVCEKDAIGSNRSQRFEQSCEARKTPEPHFLLKT